MISPMRAVILAACQDSNSRCFPQYHQPPGATFIVSDLICSQPDQALDSILVYHEVCVPTGPRSAASVKWRQNGLRLGTDGRSNPCTMG